MLVRVGDDARMFSSGDCDDLQQDLANVKAIWSLLGKHLERSL